MQEILPEELRGERRGGERNNRQGCAENSRVVRIHRAFVDVQTPEPHPREVASVDLGWGLGI